MQFEILSITTNLSRHGGAQKVLLDVHNGLKSNFKTGILGFQKFEDLHPSFNIKKEEYLKFTNPWQLNNKIIIVHARNVIPFIVVMKKIFFLNTKIIYVSHNVYSTHNLLTFFPKTIVSISNKVTDNLMNYFRRPNDSIHLIYNGIKDTHRNNNSHQYNTNGVIRILYPARVNEVKRQLQIIENLRGKLNSNIEIHFAGVGTDYNSLLEKCAQTSNFKALGFVDNMDELIPRYDFLMLFSEQEGLPISLLEGVMHGKPLLVNDVGGNLEIGIPGKNSILLDENWETLPHRLNELDKLPSELYKNMSENSRKIYENNFKYGTMIEKYISLINRV